MRQVIVITYFDEPKDELLTANVLPEALLLQQSNGRESCYVQRHWKRGPHLRLYLRNIDSTSAEETIFRLRDYLTSHPSSGSLDAAQYLKTSEFLGTQELEPPPYGPLWSDNSVFLVPELVEDSARISRLGNERALDFMERFLARSLQATYQLSKTVERNEGRKLHYGAALMTLLCAGYPNSDLLAGHISLRSHLEDYLQNFDREGKTRRTFAERYDKTRNHFHNLIQHILDNFHDGRYTGPDALLQSWGRLFQEGLSEALQLSKQGVIEEDPTAQMQQVAKGVNEQAEHNWAFGSNREYSEFHTELRKLNYLDKGQQRYSQDFSAFRWLLNLLYTILPLVGISSIQRLFLNYAISETVETIYEHSWQDIFEAATKFHKGA